MKKTISFGTLIISAALAFSGCGDETNTNANMNNSNMRNSNMMNSNSTNTNMMNSNANSMTNANSNTAVMQNNFWTNAAYGGMSEVELSKLATTKAQNAEVKQFAQTMVTDHTKANNELKALAGKKNAVLPTELNDDHKETLEELRGLSGAEFDKAYVEAMVDDHEAAVSLYEDQAEENDADAEVKAFAAKTLPTLKSHLEKIKAIQAKMK